MASYCIELLGQLVLIGLVVKIVYNVCHFAYAVCLGAALKRNLNLLDYGPWAGILH